MSSEENTKKCSKCGHLVGKNIYEMHIARCPGNQNNFSQNNNENINNSNQLPKNDHLQNQNLHDNNSNININEEYNKSEVLEKKKSEEIKIYKCPLCNNEMLESEKDDHVLGHELQNEEFKNNDNYNNQNNSNVNNDYNNNFNDNNKNGLNNYNNYNNNNNNNYNNYNNYNNNNNIDNNFYYSYKNKKDKKKIINNFTINNLIFFENDEILTMENMFKNNLKIKKNGYYGENKYHIKNCIICFENFKENEMILKLNCFHIFHKNCIENWLKKNNNCPICKNKNVNEILIKYEN